MPIDINEILNQTRDKNFELFEKHINPVLAKVLRITGFNRSWIRGEGSYLWDESGTRYLDFLTNWGVFNVGRRHPTIRNALQQVLDSDFPGWIGLDAPPLAGVLARELTKRTPGNLDIVYFCNSGTEAVEAAIKFARASTGRPCSVHLTKSFHGLTTGALSLSGEQNFRRGFEPLLPNNLELAPGDLNGLEARLAQGDVASFVFEPIQGKNVNILSNEYLLSAQNLCRKYKTLMICDEIQSGMGRSGRFLACQWIEGLQPDIICLSKALSGGYIPLGATITRRAIYDSVYDSMDRATVHACTFGMGNLAMAAGLSTLTVLDDENLLARAWAMTNKIDENLFTQAIVIPLLEDHHILTQVAGHAVPIIKILPPLNIENNDVDWFLSAFEDVMVKLHKFPGPAWEILMKISNHALSTKQKENRSTAI